MTREEAAHRLAQALQEVCDDLLAEAAAADDADEDFQIVAMLGESAAGNYEVRVYVMGVDDVPPDLIGETHGLVH